MNKDHLENSIHAFQVIAKEQEDKGIVKYGKPLNPYDKYDWLDMAAEELVDGFKYLIAEKKKRQKVIADIRYLLLNADNKLATEINKLLSELEGN